MEHPLITAVTHSTGEARITLNGVPDTPGVAGRVTTALAEANVNIDMIIQNEPVSEGRCADMSFTVPRDDLRPALDTLAPLAAELGHGAVHDETHGQGLDRRRRHAAPTRASRRRSSRRSATTSINIEMISTSPIRISCVVRGDRVPDAVRALHAAFDLQGEDTIRPEQPFGPF